MTPATAATTLHSMNLLSDQPPRIESHIAWARRFGPAGPLTSGLGLGCSRLGSALGHGTESAEAAVLAALECGITFFDTADIYGQGDSERILGRVLRRNHAGHALLATKAGFLLPAPAWALRAVKPVLRLAARLRPGRGLAAATAVRRARGYRQDFTPDRLRSALTGSLRRLQRGRVDAFLLHSPPPALAGEEAIWRLAESELRRGRIGLFGVSCDGREEDMCWLGPGRVGVVEVPMPGGIPHSHAFITAARSHGVTIIAREINSGLLDDPNREHIEASLRRASALADVILLGSTRAAHVRVNAEAADAALG